MNNAPVTIEIIETIRNHPNADRLDIATVRRLNYNFIVQRDLYSVGDKVIYIPIDSVVPDEILAKMGLDGKLKNNRVRTIKLRGLVSQGLVSHVRDFEELNSDMEEGLEVQEILGIIKHEEPPELIKNGNLHHLPAFVGRYELANAQHYPEIIDNIIDSGVYVTEKLEGSNWWASLDSDNEKYMVGQRNFEIIMEEGATHTWISTAEKINAKQKLRQIADLYKARNVTLRGEMLGHKIQGNIYKLDEHKIYIFDIEIDGIPLNAEDFLKICSELYIETVPLIYIGSKFKEFIGDKTVLEFSDGFSEINEGVLREGIVIKPLVEQYSYKVGRLAAKVKSTEYLAKEK
jgi:RNA ligase (TIGR02306 family)